MQGDEYAIRASIPKDVRESTLTQIAAEIERLSSTISELEQRLHPVLSPFNIVENDTISSPQAVQSVIRDQRDGLTLQIGRLQRMLDQLEV